MKKLIKQHKLLKMTRNHQIYHRSSTFYLGFCLLLLSRTCCCLQYSSADPKDSKQRKDYPLPNGEIIKHHSDAIESLDRNSDEMSIISQINHRFPKNKSTQHYQHYRTPKLQPSKGKQRQKAGQQ